MLLEKVLDMSRNEKETRIQLINPKLRLAGWTVLTTNGVIAPNKACIEVAVNGMPITSENPNGNGFADYVLFGDNGKPLAVIEAKKSCVDPDNGKVQACLYADRLEQMYNCPKPIIYYTNGYKIFIIDGVYTQGREIFGFHTKDELEFLLAKRDAELKDTKVNLSICDRYYQQDAIEEVVNHIKSKHTRSLIVLATGTGKTRVSCALSDIFLRNNYIKRILFLADRKNLVRQAKEETFEKYLFQYPMASIVDGKKEGDESKARIVFSTYQSMLSIIKDVEQCPYGVGYFDLIIVDEAHRSLFNKYGEIFTYFDALMIGLTATPRSDIHKSTYKVFRLETDMPNYEYDIVKGVKDGYLTYYRALDRTPDILKDGVTFDDLSEEEQDEYDDLFRDSEGERIDKIEGKMFYSYITNKGTIRAVLKDLMNEGIYVNNGDVLGKTIIFARDHNHALLIQQEFKEMFAEKCIANPVNGVDYCVVIDNKTKYNEVLQREFKNKQTIRIVISVDMMDTGVDIPEVVNLVFFKKVLSKIKFWQMVGRGTRICPDLKAKSPSKAYFERTSQDTTRTMHKDKQGFLIFDICNVFPFFKQNPDGKTDGSDSVLSLYQMIFLEKATLYKTMQDNYAQLDINDKRFYESLREELINEVKGMNRNLIGVQKNLEFVDKYGSIDSWLNLNQNSLAEIKKHLAPNVEGEIDLESARKLDLLVYRFAESKFKKDKKFMKAAKQIVGVAVYLLNKKIHIDEVKHESDSLNFINSDEFINNSTVTKLDDIRQKVRELTRFIEAKVWPTIVTDFDDKISSTADAVDVGGGPIVITIDDFKSFEEKVLFYIQNNTDKELIQQIQNIKKPTYKAIRELEGELVKIAKDADEYTSLFEDDSALIKFIRRNLEFNPYAVDLFIELQRGKGFNEMQLNYVKELLLFVSQNGYFDKQDLLRPELSFANLFNNLEITSLIKDLEERF